MTLNNLLHAVAVTLKNELVVIDEIERNSKTTKSTCFENYCTFLSTIAVGRNMLDVMPAPDERVAGVRVERSFASEDEFKRWLISRAV